ncbi:hypothetical protein BU24DRAFT_90151 [Aaosphaeria arxii CBS 175.79]|uniref:HypA-like protein n=1 Tax=Aaosphaeria arxii CBS 175.79 TaxID=1450172 RepID=A0A6A5X831_9PLEO|nr:uncharacterized protein BU24DRAFT_90151 [Aaosphaeria arxii CBS 175.79]KAF2009071.1 hypothetical protein BU24DRAFT_90151 [Aaosphaeria arxii CBS 175.79]
MNEKLLSRIADPYNVYLDAKKTPGFTHVKDLQQESADKASELLMLNHAKYHTLFNDVGLHNHIVHHICTIYALGATPEELQAAYDLNEPYQVSMSHHDDGEVSVAVDMTDLKAFKSHLGESKHYSDYLHFFQALIAKKGVEAVLKQYLFNDEESGTDLLGRMFSGFLHPILHLGFALEFQQPLLVAEALSSACIHDTWPLDILLPTERYLQQHRHQPCTPSYIPILTHLRNNPQILTATTASDPPNRVTDALLPRAGHLLPSILSHWHVDPTPDSLATHLHATLHSTILISGAAQHPRKKPSIEFFMMHSANLSALFPTFVVGLEWLDDAHKARLLNWKGWMDLVIYAANGCPELFVERVKGYVGKGEGNGGGWEEVLRRARRYPDDGHSAKFVRAVLCAKEVVGSTEGVEVDGGLGEGDFLKIARMAMDSVERMLVPGYRLPEGQRRFYVEKLGVHEEVAKIVVRFVRWCGVEGAWDGFEDLDEKEEGGGQEGRAKL